jgi:hypothetical protein
VISCFHSRYEKRSSKYQVEQIPIRCQFLENIVLINETSEQNANGYCNVELTLNQTNASFICGIKLIFRVMNLYLFLKFISSDLRSLSSL